MKKLLKKMGWMRQSGRADWQEILFDLVCITAVGGVIVAHLYSEGLIWS